MLSPIKAIPNTILTLLFIGFFAFSNVLIAQESKALENLSLKSTILKKDKLFSIYLPAGYDTSHKKLPVLYLLHGAEGNHTDWLRKGNLKRVADSAIANGKMVPMIIVMPDAEMTYYMNNIDGNYQFEDFFIKELIKHIEQNYKCLSEKKSRAIAGLSMGGFGSLLYTIHHPELFASCATLSAAIRTDDQIISMPYNYYISRYGTAMGSIKEGALRINDFWNQNSILYLANRMPKIDVRLYIDCGDDDESLYKGNSLLHVLLRDKNISHQYRVRDGGHTWQYWRNGLPDVLNFVSDGF